MTAGFTISSHICGERVKEVKINSFEKTECCCQSEEHTCGKKCCEDKLELIKITDEQIVSKSFPDNNLVQEQGLDYPSGINDYVSFVRTNINNQNYSLQKIPLFLTNRILRI